MKNVMTLFVSFSAWAMTEVFACYPIAQGLTQVQMAQVFTEIEQFLVLEELSQDQLEQEFNRTEAGRTLGKKFDSPSNFKFYWNHIQIGRGAKGDCEAISLKATSFIQMDIVDGSLCTYRANISYNDFPASVIRVSDGRFLFCG